MKRLLLLLILSVLLNIFLITLYLVRREQAIKLANARREWPDVWNKTRNSVLSGIPVTRGSTVFIGTSLTEGFPVTEFFAEEVVYNRGIMNNQSRHVVDRIDDILAGKPATIFLEIGINDIINNVDPERFTINYQSILDKCRKHSVRVIGTLIAPLNKPYEEYNTKIVAVNRIITEICKNRGIDVIDLYSAVQKEGKLRTDFTLDGLHFTRPAYVLWRDEVAKILGATK